MQPLFKIPQPAIFSEAKFGFKYSIESRTPKSSF